MSSVTDAPFGAPPVPPIPPGLAQSELRAAIWHAHYGAHAGEFGSLHMLADAGRTISAALAVIEPIQDGDSDTWTRAVRHAALASAIYALNLGRSWTPDLLNQACTTAARLTHGKHR